MEGTEFMREISSLFSLKCMVFIAGNHWMVDGFFGLHLFFCTANGDFLPVSPLVLTFVMWLNW